MSDNKIEKFSGSSIDKKVEKNVQHNNIIEQKQEVVIEKNKLESDIHADIDSTTQRKDLALEVQKYPYVKELNNLKPEVINTLGSNKDIQPTENQESWFARNKAWLIGAGGVGLGAWLLKPWKWFSDDESKEKNKNESSSTGEKKTETKDEGKNITVNVDNTEKKSMWQKAMPWLFGGSAVLGTGYLFRDKLKETKLGIWIDDMLHPKLSFDTALNVAQGNVMNKANENHMKQDPKLEWNKDTKKLSVFGQDFDVDIDNKKIKGLEIQFTKYEDLIATAIMIGSIKNAFRGKCANDKPFSLTEMGGDIEIQLSDQAKDAVSGAGIQVGKISGGVLGATLGGLAGAYGLKSLAGTVGGVVGGGIGGAAIGSATLDHNDTLSQICPSLNDEKNKNALIGYLIGMGGWIAGKDQNIEKKGQTTDKKVNTIFVNTLKKVEGTRDENDDNNVDRGTERNASITNYNNRPDILELNAWGCVSYFHTKLDAKGNIISVTVEDTGVTFTGPKAVEQAIHLGLFINQCEKELCGQSLYSEAFKYGFDIGKSNGNGIRFTKERWFGKYLPQIWTMKFSKGSLEKNIPYLLEGENMNKFIGWLNSRKSGGSSLWTNKSYQGRTNTYIQKLQNTTTPILTKNISESQQKKAA